MEKKKKLIILGIIALTLVIIGTTYAILTWTSTKINLGLTSGCFTIDYTKGQDITNQSIKLINEEDLISDGKFTIKDGIALTYANIGINSSCTIEGYGILKLNVTSLSDAFITGESKGSLKYAVLKNTSSSSTITVTSLLNQSFDLVSRGSITKLGTIDILTEQLSNNEIYKYLIVVYTDNNLVGNDVIGSSFTGNISAEAYQGKLTFADTITNLYKNATKTPVTNNSINYEYDTANNLMQDIGGNIRYYGASPNNYVYFNCSDYANQTSSTCEIWRIIGVFEGKVKIMRGSIIGSYSWDNKNTSTGAEDDFGKNDWTDARLTKLLNPGYELETTGGSLYYNAGSGNCYSGRNNATKTCDFTSTGIKNDTTRNLISDTTYYLGGWNSSSVYPDVIYSKERGTTVYSGRPTSWTGKIALPYPSDYGYAADLSKCTKNLYNYSSSTCTSNNWMKSIFTSNGWLLTPNSASWNSVWSVSSSGDVYQSGVFNALGVAPVLSLGSELSVGSGYGSSSDPYQLSA